MKTALAMGDSLIAGNIGESFLEHSREIRRFNLINQGQDGEPVKGILRNLKDYLESGPLPDILILDGGGNDLLIPYMTEHHPKEWGPFFRKLSRHGSTPAEDLQEFRGSFGEILKLTEEAGIKQLILMTIPNLSESLAHPLNEQRKILNREIRNLQKSSGNGMEIQLADMGRVTESALLPLQPGSDWLFSSPADMAAVVSEEISRSRGLHLTTDGVHLNKRGAALLAEELDRILQEIQS
jgi:lysophospholipase L1-like esterase